MFKNKNILAIIPARGGSKGIKNKNLKKIFNQSLVARAILFAKKIKHIDDIVVSTDSGKIKKEAINCGIKFPFFRPKKLSGDNISDFDVLVDVLKKTEKLYKKKYDYITMLQPTSPLRTSQEFKECLLKIYKKKFDSVWTISEIDKKYNHLKQFRVQKDKIFLIDKKGYKVINRQALAKTYIRNGAIYIFSRDCLVKQKNIYGKKQGYFISTIKHISIDTVEDLQLIKNYLNKKY